MGRRSAHTSDELRGLILSAARDIIETEGLTALSAREIARRIGYSAGTLYNIFDNLDDIRLTLQIDMLEDLSVKLSALKSNGDTKRLVSQTLKTYVEFTFANRQLWNLLFERREETAAIRPQASQASLERIATIVADALGAALPDVPHEQISHHARILCAGVHGITAVATTNRIPGINRETAILYVEKLGKTYLKGLVVD